MGLDKDTRQQRRRYERIDEYAQIMAVVVLAVQGLPPEASCAHPLYIISRPPYVFGSGSHLNYFLEATEVCLR